MTLAEKIIRAKEDYDAVYADGKADAEKTVLAMVNGELAPRGLECADNVDEIPTRLDDGFESISSGSWHSGYDKGYEDGSAAGGGEDDLPYGYIKVDPTWNSWYMLCANRPSMVQSLKYEDSANATHFVSVFQSCNVEIIPRLDLRKATTIQNMFIYSSKIVEIGEMEIPKVTVADNAFAGCTGLERISFVPNCINVSINFASCSKLDDASIQSIIDGLADMTGQTAQTLTFHNTVGLRLTFEHHQALSVKNWNIVY